MSKEIEILVKDGDKEYTCKVRRPDVATLSRVRKLEKTDDVLAAQELLKNCWVNGDMEIQNDAFLMLVAASQLGALINGVSAEVKN
jgi:hypothetical protein